ncbi:MAG: ATP-binding cassette domain-containing protein [Bacillota bacterium]
MPVVRVENIWHRYARGLPFETVSLRGVSLEVHRGETLAVIGAAGSGKSTLLQHLNGLLLPDEGRVLVCGADTRDRKARKKLWARVGLILQYPERQFFEETVFREVSFGPRNLGLPSAEIGERVSRALDMVGLDREIYNHSPFMLSGGEQRRVAIASILAVRPEVLVLDEPTAGLDPGGRKKLFQTLDVLKGQGITIVMSSHNMDDVAKMADRVVLLKKGEKVLEGNTRQVFSRPGEITGGGLDLPFPCEVARRLNDKGFAIEDTPLDMDEAVESILNRLAVNRRLKK